MAGDGVATFGPYRLVPAERLLQRDGLPVALGSRALDLLIALVEHAGEVLSQRELMARAWPNLTVEEGNLRVTIAGLRKALGEGQDGARYIANVPGRGYCFVAPVDRIVDRPGTPALAPASRRSVAAGLPPALERMVGRGETVAELCSLLAARRFVSIVGPGGMGKTTVAVAMAHALLESFDGAIVFVDLAALTDPALVPATLATALGLATRRAGPHAGPPGPSRRPARPDRAGQLRARDRGGSRSGRADLRRSTARAPAGHQPGGAARRGRDPASAAAAGDAGRDGGADGGPGPRFAGRRAVHAARARQRAWRRAHGSGRAAGGRDLPAARRDRARHRAGGQPGRSLRPGRHGEAPEQPLQAALAGAAQRPAPAPDAACHAGLELQPPLRARPPCARPAVGLRRRLQPGGRAGRRGRRGAGSRGAGRGDRKPGRQVAARRAGAGGSHAVPAARNHARLRFGQARA